MPSANQRLGEYVLIERIGQGAFGEVWRAHHHAWVERIVAVKIPNDPQHVRGLQNEGNAASRLSHPNIVKALAFDPYADPPYFVMEYVPGTNLRTLILRGPMLHQHAVAVMRQVLSALHHAHGHGLIHRDIKPENILIHKSVSQKGLVAGTVLLTDFGMGKVTAQNANSIVMTEDRREGNQIVGSLQYMAPEQRDGKDIDARADLFSCGVVLFEMLTSHRPAGMELPSEVNPSVPKSLDDVFRRAFTRVERRFSSAQQFFEALSQHDPNPVAPVPSNQTGGKRARELSKRRGRLLTLVSVLAALCILSSLFVVGLRLEPQPSNLPRSTPPIQTPVADPSAISSLPPAATSEHLGAHVDSNRAVPSSPMTDRIARAPAPALGSMEHGSVVTEIAPPLPPPPAAKNFQPVPASGVLVTFDSVLKQLPKETQPSSGWDDFSLPGAHKWLKQRLAGREFKIVVELMDVKVVRISKPSNPDETIEWDITLTTGCVNMRAFGMDPVLWPSTWVAEKYFDSDTGDYQPLPTPGFSFFADSQLQKFARSGRVLIRSTTEETAKRARSWSAGEIIVLAGPLDDLDIKGGATAKGTPTGIFNAIFKEVRVIEMTADKQEQQRLMRQQATIGDLP